MLSQPSKEYLLFIERLQSLVDMDLTQYKPGQMERRIRHFIDRCHAGEFQEFYERLKQEPELLKKFVDCITINVSEFFRDTEKYRELEEKVMPLLLKRNRKLRVWSAGCSNGAEPYSIAMLLKKLDPGTTHYILATDIDLGILQRSKEGHYLDREVRGVDPQDLETYFTELDMENYHIAKPRYAIKDDIKRLVQFRHHNLLKDPCEKNFDLIICRNVVIYFTREAQQVLYTRFSESLNEGGFLFVGATESLLDCQRYGLSRFSTAFYRKESIDRFARPDSMETRKVLT